jgi:hypothetical protein
METAASEIQAAAVAGESLFAFMSQCGLGAALNVDRDGNQQANEEKHRAEQDCLIERNHTLQ